MFTLTGRLYQEPAAGKAALPGSPASWIYTDSTTLYFTEFLNDENPAERQQGMAAGLELLQVCQELWAYIPPGGLPSEGMQQEINYAMDKGIEVKIMYERG